MAALAELESDDAAEHLGAEALLQAEQLRQLQEDLAAARQRQVCCRLTTAGRAGVHVTPGRAAQKQHPPLRGTQGTDVTASAERLIPSSRCPIAVPSGLSRCCASSCLQSHRAGSRAPDAAHEQDEEAASTAARFRELEAALAEAEVSLADEADALPRLEAQLAEAQKQVGRFCEGHR